MPSDPATYNICVFDTLTSHIHLTDKPSNLITVCTDRFNDKNFAFASTMLFMFHMILTVDSREASVMKHILYRIQTETLSVVEINFGPQAMSCHRRSDAGFSLQRPELSSRPVYVSLTQDKHITYFT
jgi:hypothetical protein